MTPVQSNETASPGSVVDLATCNDVNYEVRDGVHGVSYREAKSKETNWTPVVAKRKKKHSVPFYVHCRFPPDHPIHHQNTISESSDSGSGSDCDLDSVIPSQAVNIHYNEVDGTPGLSVWTSKLDCRHQ